MSTNETAVSIRRMIPRDWDRMVDFFNASADELKRGAFEFLDGDHSERDYWIALNENEELVLGLMYFDKKESRLPRVAFTVRDGVCYSEIVTGLIAHAKQILHNKKGAALFVSTCRDDEKTQKILTDCELWEIAETHGGRIFAYAEPCENPIGQDLFKKCDEYEIRRIVPEDRPLIYDFFRAMGEESTGFFNRNHGNENGVYDYLDGKLPDRTYWMAVKKDNGKEICLGIVFICMKFTKLPGFGIAVRDGYHGMHIGTNLIEFVKEVCRANHCGGIMLTTAFTNEKGQRLYEHRGFQRSGIQCGEWFYICPLK